VARSGETPQQTYNYLINNSDAVISAVGPTNFNQMLKAVMKQLGLAA